MYSNLGLVIDTGSSSLPASVAARETAENSVQHLDENIAALGRAAYPRGSVDVHTGRARQEILNFKMYADGVLGELLEIH